MPNIKEIALKVLDSKSRFRIGLDAMLAQDFAEALIAEIAKGNEPVAFTNSCELDYLDFKRADSGLVSAAMWKDYDKDSDIALYTLPPTASQIEQETAEACAKACEDVIGNTPHDQRMLAAIDCAVMLRSGAWKEFK